MGLGYSESGKLGEPWAGGLKAKQTNQQAEGQSWGGMPGGSSEAFRSFYNPGLPNQPLLGVGFAQAPWVILIQMHGMILRNILGQEK